MLCTATRSKGLQCGPSFQSIIRQCNMLSTKRQVFILLVPLLKLCTAVEIEDHSKDLAYTQAHAAKPTNHSYTTTSYFQSELQGPDTYAFGYEVVDRSSANTQFRHERRYVNGTIDGNYGYLRPDGLITVTRYQADKQLGYRSQLSTYQPNEGQTHPEWVQLGWPEAIKNGHEHFNAAEAAMSAGVQEQQGDDFTAQQESEERPDHAALSPLVGGIINGRVPLQWQANENSSVVGIEKVENFLPRDFPIVPFELPSRLDDNRKQEEHAAKDDKDEKVKENSAQMKIWMKSMDPERESLQLREIHEVPAEGDDRTSSTLDKTGSGTLQSAALFTNGTATRLADVIRGRSRQDTESKAMEQQWLEFGTEKHRKAKNRKVFY